MFKNITWSSFIAPGIFLLFILYFLYYTFYGARGLFTLKQVTYNIELAQQDLDELRTKRLSLEHRVSHLHPDHLDKDLLEEQIRQMLGRANSHDLIIFESAQ